jgi:hypothetical protein
MAISSGRSSHTNQALIQSEKDLPPTVQTDTTVNDDGSVSTTTTRRSGNAHSSGPIEFERLAEQEAWLRERSSVYTPRLPGNYYFLSVYDRTRIMEAIHEKIYNVDKIMRMSGLVFLVSIGVYMTN